MRRLRQGCTTLGREISHHLIGDEGWQEVFVRHWDWGEFWNWLRGKVSHRVGIGTKVGIAGRASRGWSRSLGGLPLDEGGRSRLCGCWIGGVLGASREARMMLHVLMCTMRGLRGLDPCGRQRDGMSIFVLIFSPVALTLLAWVIVEET